MTALAIAFACAWCQRVRTAADRWESVGAGDLNSPGITHGICEECLDRETAALLAREATASAGPER